MKRTKITPQNRERAFNISELFFSTTDPKGIIKTCNDLFVRVSGFPSTELIARPHNIIRHPDMPRAVFKLLWDFLLSGRSIGAFVKNMAATGEYYWVFALAAPIDEGYLSVRLKPSSAFLPIVQGLYTELLELENSYGDDWRSGMDAAYNELGNRLNKLGFNSYEAFMGEALREELVSRSKLMKAESSLTSTAQDRALSSLTSMVTLRDKLTATAKELHSFVFELGLVAINASVQAAHLGNEGHTLAVIGGEVAEVSRNITAEVGNLRDYTSELSKKIGEASFALSMACLQSEMSASFRQDKISNPRSDEEEIRDLGARSDDLCKMLEELAAKSSASASQSLRSLAGTMKRFKSFCEFLTRILMTLQFAYVTGKTEASKVQHGEGFSVLLDDLITLSTAARGSLDELSLNVGTVERTVSNNR